MYLHDDIESADDGASRAGDEDACDGVEERNIECRRCQIEVSRYDFIFAARDGRSVHVFPNPSGVMQEIVTLTTVRSVVAEGIPTSAFTWFSGYAWTVATCAGCKIHLGWRFDGVGSGPSRTFYGLLVARLAGLQG